MKKTKVKNGLILGYLHAEKESELNFSLLPLTPKIWMLGVIGGEILCSFLAMFSIVACVGP